MANAGIPFYVKLHGETRGSKEVTRWVITIEDRLSNEQLRTVVELNAAQGPQGEFMILGGLSND